MSQFALERTSHLITITYEGISRMASSPTEMAIFVGVAERGSFAGQPKT
jgi:hypothetical protein